MIESNLTRGWVAMVESLAMVAIILMAIGLMVGLVKPADTLKNIGAVLGVVIILILAPPAFACLWSGISLWQRIGIATLVIGIWQCRRPRRRTLEK